MTRHTLWLFRRSVGAAFAIVALWIVGILAGFAGFVGLITALSPAIGPPAAAVTCILIGLAFGAYAVWSWRRAR
ncbi:hypothetical protein [Nocardia gipuzkoensis]|uniref:hypothetical protein n=1 Tax=Nocardia gipuzkoensis TaxID=2749991 RepID=UPI00237E65F1|nr:hypothetical protein [Nocardia gipuzkoensis]MDE1673761.1 hypothetical protein [Nocardia gipuzkoensis]